MPDEVKESFLNCGRVRTFDSGATRDTDKNKLDFEGFLSPVVLQKYAAYLHKHRFQSDGNWRDSDNWQKGIPKDTYIKSAFRHFMDWWLEHRGCGSREGIEDALMGLLFNIMGYAFEYFKEIKEIESKYPRREVTCKTCKHQPFMSTKKCNTCNPLLTKWEAKDEQS